MAENLLEFNRSAKSLIQWLEFFIVHELMNSNSEYNRCSLPRLSTKMGENEYKEYNNELEKDKQEEEILDKKIRELRKEANKKRLHPTKEHGPKPKKRKVEPQEYITIEEIWGNPRKSGQEKSKKTEDKNPKEQEKYKKSTDANHEKIRITEFPPPPPQSPEISQLLSKQEQFRQERMHRKTRKRKSF